MFNWLSTPTILLAAVILVAVQFIAALPWLKVLSPKGFAATIKNPVMIGAWVLGLIGVSILVAMFMGYKGVMTMVEHLQGKPVEKRIDTGVVLVTPENMAQPEMQELLYPPIEKYLNSK